MQQKIHSAPTLVYPSSDGKPMSVVSLNSARQQKPLAPIAEIAKAHGLTSIIDNTFARHGIIKNPCHFIELLGAFL